ncbi:MAG: AMP-binding protein [Burkholderiales bacterium]|nr:AMP-binding protein [Burkholderiales bacterium]MDE1927003.1 AMP-binding protein [Burkholderiales bacterium]MDE2159657.1 AMP-binding protein [Burkholderiales bacterium]MDE2505332.1 AMP-binding protein [Burkholderiales bacterium]
MDKIWLRRYPAGVPATVATGRYPSLAALLDDVFERHRDRVAYRCLGRELRYGEVDQLARAFAAWLLSTGLQRGDRVAIMLPNLPQYPVVAAAVLRAGLVVVNVNPLFQARELEHQLRDSGARAIVVLENFAATLQRVLESLPLRHVVVAAAGDLLGPVRGRLVNHVVRHVRKQVSAYELPGALRFADALAAGRRQPPAAAPAAPGPDDIALLQYTGGTTGVSRGAVLLHRQLVANVMQAQAWYEPALARLPAGEQPVTVCALPLYHIFGFSSVLLLSAHAGGCCILIPDARDTDALLRTLRRERFHALPAVNTLFDAIARHPDAARVDWSGLRLSLGGGMAVQRATAQRWHELTGCPICEGYGLSETSPAVACNPVDASAFSGSIGLPLPGTEVKVIDDAGREVETGLPGELAIRGPQVMAGYWQRPDETARAMTADGYLRSGDIGIQDEQGELRIVDRKKDMILVGGFKVYPNEIEELVAQLPGVLECAAVAQADGAAGEAVRLIVVRRDPASGHPSEAEVRAHCAIFLTGYKRPKRIEFSGPLPKSPLGKILRRELRGPN